MLDDVLPSYGNAFKLKMTLVSGPYGWVRSARLGIHAVPALAIGDEVLFRSVPSREELIQKLDERRDSDG